MIKYFSYIFQFYYLNKTKIKLNNFIFIYPKTLFLLIYYLFQNQFQQINLFLSHIYQYIKSIMYLINQMDIIYITKSNNFTFFIHNQLLISHNEMYYILNVLFNNLNLLLFLTQLNYLLIMKFFLNIYFFDKNYYHDCNFQIYYFLHL